MTVTSDHSYDCSVANLASFLLNLGYVHTTLVTLYLKSNVFLVLERFLVFWRLLSMHVSLCHYCLQRAAGAVMSSSVRLPAVSWSSFSCSQSRGILGSDDVLLTLKHRKAILNYFASHLPLLWKLQLHWFRWSWAVGTVHNFVPQAMPQLHPLV